MCLSSREVFLNIIDLVLIVTAACWFGVLVPIGQTSK